MLRLIGHYLWIALKAIGRFLLWLGSWLLHRLSDAISWCRLNLSGRAQTILLAVIIALIIVGVALIFTGRGCSNNPSDSEVPAAEEVPPPKITYDPQEADIQSFTSTPDTITSFSLVQTGNQMYAELSEENNAEITEALSYLEKDSTDVGFLIVNLSTGSGYCYNIDTPIYGASTYKAPLSVFLCEEYIDGGTLQKSAVSTRIENAIVWSDNTSYRSLKHGFEGSNHNNWLLSLGIDPTRYNATFPTYSVRDSATLWLHTWEYLNSDSSTAEWLAGLLSRTQTSFLRNGAEQAGMEEVTIYNKAGWCVSQTASENSVSDAGIVVDGDNVYLVVAFTSLADTPGAESNLSDLFEALLNVRHDLDASMATWDNVEVVAAPSEASTESSDSDNADETIMVEAVESGGSKSSDTAASGNAGMAQQSPQIIVEYSDGTSLLIAEARR